MHATRGPGPFAERMTLLVPLAMLALVSIGTRSPRPELHAATRAAEPPQRVLRVCSDPNNLPFSNSRLEGFENELATLVAGELGARLEYVWWAQRRGFIRNTLRAGACDVVMGIPTSVELTLPTRPYYRSTYVFVQRRDAAFRVRSFDDSILKRLRIAVQMIGDDYANSPPAHALANRGIVDNVRGFLVYGDYRQANPPARIVDAVARGDVDVAVVWGPLAGYFAARHSRPLTVIPVSPQIDLPFTPFVFDISMGVRREDTEFRAELDAVLRKRRASVDSILAKFGVPRADRPATDPAS